jgi:hypothetical protein
VLVEAAHHRRVGFAELGVRHGRAVETGVKVVPVHLHRSAREVYLSGTGPLQSSPKGPQGPSGEGLGLTRIAESLPRLEPETRSPSTVQIRRILCRLPLKLTSLVDTGWNSPCAACP